MITNTDPTPNLRPDKEVLVFSSVRQAVADGGSGRVPIAGVVLRAGRVPLPKRIMLRLFERVLRAPREQLQSELFRRRIGPFAAATKRGRRIVVRVGERLDRLCKKSNRSGHCRGMLRLDAATVDSLRGQGVILDGWLRFEIVTPSDARVGWDGSKRRRACCPGLCGKSAAERSIGGR